MATKVYRRVFRNAPKRVVNEDKGPASVSSAESKKLAAEKARQESEERKAKEEAAQKKAEETEQAAAEKAKEDAYNKIKEEAAARQADKQAAKAAAEAASKSVAKSGRQFPKCQLPQRLDLATADATRMEALCVKSQMLNRSSSSQWWKKPNLFDEIKIQLTRSPSAVLPSMYFSTPAAVSPFANKKNSRNARMLFTRQILQQPRIHAPS